MLLQAVKRKFAQDLCLSSSDMCIATDWQPVVILTKLKRKLKNKRVWVLRNLIRAGWNRVSVIKIYKTVNRPMIEFSCVIYASMLTSDKSQALEALQKRALRMILGWEKSYYQLLGESGIKELEVRRKAIVEKFAMRIKRVVLQPLVSSTWNQQWRLDEKQLIQSSITQRFKPDLQKLNWIIKL